MNYAQAKLEFDKLGYELTHALGTEGKGYYIRKRGESDEVYVTDYLEALEERIFKHKEEAICA